MISAPLRLRSLKARPGTAVLRASSKGRNSDRAAPLGNAAKKLAAQNWLRLDLEQIECACEWKPITRVGVLPPKKWVTPLSSSVSSTLVLAPGRTDPTEVRRGGDVSPPDRDDGMGSDA